MGHKEEREARQLAHEEAMNTIGLLGRLTTLAAAGGVIYWVATDDLRGLVAALGSLVAFWLWGMWKGYI
jgi:hypothetical protein